MLVCSSPSTGSAGRSHLSSERVYPTCPLRCRESEDINREVEVRDPREGL